MAPRGPSKHVVPWSSDHVRGGLSNLLTCGYRSRAVRRSPRRDSRSTRAHERVEHERGGVLPDHRYLMVLAVRAEPISRAPDTAAKLQLWTGVHGRLVPSVGASRSAWPASILSALKSWYFTLRFGLGSAGARLLGNEDGAGLLPAVRDVGRRRIPMSCVSSRFGWRRRFAARWVSTMG